MALRFDGRVAIVTGAGAGLGKAYALLLASRGAKVVVNEFGGDRYGDYLSSKEADAVVQEITSNGGTAVPDYNSVINGNKIIQTALDHFGRVDILVNNAGILRDYQFEKMSDEDWDLVHDVNLKGSFITTRAAFRVFKKQGYGRVVMTSSNSGLYGDFYQANYSAAKMGLVGLTSTVAIEGADHNIHCNVIVPTAATKLNEDCLPLDLYTELKPELIAPVVAYLCHESCPENGTIIESAGGWAGKCHLIRANGSLLRTKITDEVILENVRDNWAKVTSMDDAKHMGSTVKATGSLITSLETLRTGHVHTERRPVFEFTENDLILYNFAVGASLQNKNELKYVYENHENFSVLPTFYIMPSAELAFDFSRYREVIPGKTINAENVLHGEQYTEFLGSLPKQGKLKSRVSVAEVLDKGSGATVVLKGETFDEQGKLIIRNQCVIFVLGAGNFGGPRRGVKIIPCQPKPSRAPDFSIAEKTSVDQSALYRLLGDRQPLHIDPNFRHIAGFKEPILHGLCTLGFSVRLLLRAFAGGDGSLVKAIKVRFQKPVIPGETLRVDMWKEGNRIHFEAVVVESNTVVLSGAYVDLTSVKMAPIANNVAAATLESDAIFEFIIEQVKADPNKAKSIGGVFLYKITKNGKEAKQWTMDLKNANVYEGAPEGRPTTTLTIADEDFMLLAQGKLQPQAAFMKGKLKITGNIMLAQKLAPLLKANAKL